MSDRTNPDTANRDDDAPWSAYAYLERHGRTGVLAESVATAAELCAHPAVRDAEPGEDVWTWTVWLTDDAEAELLADGFFEATHNGIVLRIELP